MRFQFGSRKARFHSCESERSNRRLGERILTLIIWYVCVRACECVCVCVYVCVCVSCNIRLISFYIINIGIHVDIILSIFFLRTLLVWKKSCDFDTVIILYNVLYNKFLCLFKISYSMSYCCHNCKLSYHSSRLMDRVFIANGLFTLLHYAHQLQSLMNVISHKYI
jgi:hypothetical protein